MSTSKTSEETVNKLMLLSDGGTLGLKFDIHKLADFVDTAIAEARKEERSDLIQHLLDNLPTTTPVGAVGEGAREFQRGFETCATSIRAELESLTPNKKEE